MNNSRAHLFETEASGSPPDGRQGDVRPLELSGRQRLLYRALNEKSPEIAELYESALRVLADCSNPGRLFLAAHAIREMADGLPKFLDLPTLAEQGRLGDRVSALEKTWVNATKSQCRKDGQWAGEIDDPLRTLLEVLEEFLQWWKDNRPRRRDVAARLFRSTDPSGMPLPETLEQKRVGRWMELRDYFVRVAHQSSTTEEEFRSALSELEQILLDSLYRRPSEDFSAIDSILAEEASGAYKPETVAKALHEIEKGYAQYQYFFDKLASPAWLEPLHGHGFFQDPRPPVRDGQYISFPLWPESRYLVRMARIPEAQETVLRIALAISARENSRVHDDLADIALALPAPQSAQLVPQLRAVIPNSVKLRLAEKVGDLIVHLARGGEGEAALQLAAAALELRPDPRFAEPADEELLLSPEPQAHFRNWYYNRIVDKAVPALVSCSGIEAVRLVCKLLDDAIRYSRKPEEEGEEDYLYIRHPAIEHGKDHDDIPSVLLCAARDAAEQLVTAELAQFRSVIAPFAEHKWVTFRRLELHLARVFLDEGLTLAERVFQDPDLLDRPSLRHEAVLLLKAAFSRLTPETQQRILSWIDAGPPGERMRFVGEPVTDEKIRALIDRRRLENFSILEGQLPQPYQRTYEDLKARLGTPAPPDRVSYPKFGAISAESPRSTEELAAIPVAEVLEFLRTWAPGHNIFEPTAEGLGGAFTGVVSKRPAEFAAAAERMQGLDPTYIRGLFSGLTEALKRGEAWDWGPVLRLAKWVVDQGREIPGRTSGLMDADPDWGWTRTAVIDLLSAGFEKPERLPLEHRGLVWHVLQPLTDDPNPAPDDERGEKFDPSFRSINSTRGRALDAVIDYAWWLRGSTDAARKAEGQPPITFDSMPEVRAVLEAHLDVEREPTLTIRSVYGRRLTSLAGLDWDWLRANVSRILPEGAEDPKRFMAAWESFVCFNPPNTTLLSVLMPAYKRAVAQIGQPGGMMQHHDLPEDRLAEHLMVYYWLGLLEFGSADGLLDAFYAAASDRLRGHAMWFVGTSVSHWDESAPPQLYERLKKLVERRIEVARQAPGPADFVHELANFGWWFASEKFDERWSIETLVSTLHLTRKAEGEMDVVKLLAARCARYPVECVTCLRLMIEGDQERWLLLGVENDAMELLQQALRSNNPKAVLSARRLAEELIARGYFGFRALVARCE